MRFLIINLLATALLFVGASTAGAFALSSASPDTVPTELTIGDQITVTVTLDTEGEASLTLLSAGLLFNPDILSYNPGATRTSSYLLFVSGKGATANMTPAFDPPAIRFGTTDQINLDFVSSSLTSGSGATGIAYWDGGASSGPDGTVQQMIILAFDVIGNWATAVALSVTASGNAPSAC